MCQLLIKSRKINSLTDLGSLKKLNPRTQWPNEAVNFTPWLAEEENIQLLATALGIELEVESIEAAVGPYSADILARDTATGNYVIIENQLSKTDHDHLGKMITYAAFLGASAIVWLAPKFTDEHKKALDWLNDNSSEDISFYGVVVELWQIDKSLPAVMFNVTSKPLGLVRKVGITKTIGELSKTKKLQLEWWKFFSDELLKKKVIPSVRKPLPQSWYDVPLGRSGIHISNIANTYDRKIKVRVYLRTSSNADAALIQLLDQREEIEAELGTKLIWNPYPENQDKTICVYHDADISKREKWQEYCDWMIDMTKNFREVFIPRVRELNLSIEREVEPDN